MDRRRLARGLVTLLIGSLVLASAGTTLAYEPDAQPDLGNGRVVSPAGSQTVVGVQGFHHDGSGDRSTAEPVGRAVDQIGDAEKKSHGPAGGGQHPRK